jgi:hypothetical protein
MVLDFLYHVVKVCFPNGPQLPQVAAKASTEASAVSWMSTGAAV